MRKVGSEAEGEFGREDVEVGVGVLGYGRPRGGEVFKCSFVTMDRETN